MSKQRISFLIVVTMLVLAIQACAFPGAPTVNPTQPEQASPAPGETQPAATPAEKQPTATTEPSPTPKPTLPPALPIGLRQGLASLNSYEVTYGQILEGPGPQDKNHITTVFSYSTEGDRSHTQATILNTSADNPDNPEQTSDRYQVGSKICSLPASEEGVSPVTSSDPMAEEMTTVLSNQMDLTLYVENPVLVGEVGVNGIQTRHYTFNVSGLGKKSGAEVTQSSGEYWSAIDGNYLVKYHLVMEMRNAPQGSSAAEVIHSELSYNLNKVNQPLTIEMPPECK